MQGVSAVLLVQAAARTSCTAAQLLRAQGLNPEGLELEGTILHCQPLPLRGPWECREGGLPTPPCLAMCCAYAGGGRRGTAMRTWTGSIRGEGSWMPPLAGHIEALRGAAPHARTARVGITLDPRVLLRKDVKRGAWGWTRATVREFVGDFVASADPS